MKKNLLLLILFSLCVFSLSAQTNISKGKIYLEEGVLDGYVMTQIAEDVPQTFSFSSAPNGRFSSPQGAIRKVELENGLIYQKYFISLPLSANDWLSRHASDYNEVVAGERYLQLLLKGTASLYKYTDPYGYSHFFYRLEKDTALTWLVNKPYNNEQGYYVEDVAYRNQVSMLQRSICPDAGVKDLSKLAYRTEPLMAAFRTVNQCGSSVVEDHFTASQRGVLRLGVMGGAMYKSVQFSNGSWQSLLMPTFGVSLQVKSARSTVGIDLGYTSFVVEGQVPRQFDKYMERIEIQQFELSPYYRIRLHQSRLEPYLDLGAAIAIGKYAVRTTYQNGVVDEDSRSRLNISPFGGLGLSFNKLSLQFDYKLSAIGSGFNAYGITGRYFFLN